MFDIQQIELIDRKYFNVFTLNDYDIALQSRCTGHCWCIRSADDGSCIIFHKHKKRDQYHRQGNSQSLQQALRWIKDHDSWQQKGRPKE